MKNLLIIFFSFIIISCSEIERSPKPDSFFEVEKMAAIMTDVYLIEGSMTSNRKSFTDLGIVPDEYIYNKHGIDSISFKANFNYYVDRVDEYLIVMDLVDDKLLVIKDSINKRQNDSQYIKPDLKPVERKNAVHIDSIRSKFMSYPSDAR